MSGGGRTRVAMLGVAALIMLAGCADEPTVSGGVGAPAPASATRTVTSPPSILPQHAVWLAVLRVEKDPNALDHDAQGLLAAIGAGVVVSPASCYQGLTRTIDTSSYLLGLEAPSEDELTALVDRAGRPVSSISEVTLICTD